MGLAHRSFGALVLAHGAAGCLLYTEPINSPPAVTIHPPPTIYRNAAATFTADVADPDGDDVSLSWALAPRRCVPEAPVEWQPAPPAVRQFVHTPTSRDPFCLRARARDRHGAETLTPGLEIAPRNRPPAASLALESPRAAGGAVPLYSLVRVSAAGSRDEDGDRPEPRTFTVRGPSDVESPLKPCGGDGAKNELVRCFEAEHAGDHVVTLVVTDGDADSAPATLTVRVAEDGPPCIDTEQTEPDVIRASVVLMAPDEAPRTFAIRRVADDGHPHPPGPRGGTTFVWSIRQAGGWTRLLDSVPQRLVGAFLFDDVRPGRTYDVRVEARDPARDNGRATFALDQACKNERLCEEPKGCFRWVGWTVRFQ